MRQSGNMKSVRKAERNNDTDNQGSFSSKFNHFYFYVFGPESSFLSTFIVKYHCLEVTNSRTSRYVSLRAVWSGLPIRH